MKVRFARPPTSGSLRFLPEWQAFPGQSQQRHPWLEIKCLYFAAFTGIVKVNRAPPRQESLSA
jgi:hypothetical protein